MPTGESEVFELCGCSHPPLDRRERLVSSGRAEWRDSTGTAAMRRSGGARAEGGDCRWKDGRALRKGSLGRWERRKGMRWWRGRKLKGGVTTPCRMQNRGSIIVIERRHYRGAQNVVVIRIFPFVFTSLCCLVSFSSLPPSPSSLSLSLSLSFFFLF